MATVRAPQRGAVARARPIPRETEQPKRPQLRVVDEPTRRFNLVARTTIAVGVLFAVLFGLVVFHTVLLQNQQRLDQVDAQVRDAQARYQQLRLQVAQLEAPQRIVDAATQKLGMVQPQGTTYLTPAPGTAATPASTPPASEQSDQSDHAGTG